MYALQRGSGFIGPGVWNCAVLPAISLLIRTVLNFLLQRKISSYSVSAGNIFPAIIRKSLRD